MIWYRLHGFDIELTDDRTVADVLQVTSEEQGDETKVVRTVVARFSVTCYADCLKTDAKGKPIGPRTPEVLAQQFAKKHKGRTLPEWKPEKKENSGKPSPPKKSEGK